MISVILNGRNDNYGYNLHKRVSININCLAEMLTDKDDEIIFVDCNTSNSLNTLPEAIHDILTPKAKSLIRVFRIRPETYRKYKRNSGLAILDSLSRNVGIRRSNQSNRWILSSTTDMVFVPKNKKSSLTEIASNLTDGFYELPRFDVPENLWIEFDRKNPDSIIDLLRNYGDRLHLNIVKTNMPEILYDAPGDFQLMLREQVFQIYGFNEEMVLTFHMDSNIAKRLFILNNFKTGTLVEYIYGYHLNHILSYSDSYSSKPKENDVFKFWKNVSNPIITAQKNTWGLPNEDIEEIRLDNNNLYKYSSVVQLLSSQKKEFIEYQCDHEGEKGFNTGLIYDNFHTFSFLSSYLINMPLNSNIGYIGSNTKLLSLLTAFLDKIGFTGNIYEVNNFTRREIENCAEYSDIIIFDAYCGHLPLNMTGEGNVTPLSSGEFIKYVGSMFDVLSKCVKKDKELLKNSSAIKRKYIFIGIHNSIFYRPALNFFKLPASSSITNVYFGYLSFNNFFIKKMLTPFLIKYNSKLKSIKKIPLIGKIAKLLYNSAT